jgi:hypothetical protein
MVDMEKSRFSFEDLDVWRKGVGFCKDVIDLAEGIVTDAGTIVSLSR